jgi:hypothetical protein
MVAVSWHGVTWHLLGVFPHLSTGSLGAATLPNQPLAEVPGGKWGFPYPTVARGRVYSTPPPVKTPDFPIQTLSHCWTGMLCRLQSLCEASGVVGTGFALNVGDL